MVGASSEYDFARRVRRARELMAAQDLSGLYIAAGANMRYFTGFTAYPGGWPIWLSCLVLPADGDPVLILSDMHLAIYKSRGGSWVEDVRTYMDGQNPTNLLREVLRGRGMAGGRIGVEDNMWFGDSELIRAAVADTQIKSAGSIFSGLRMVKDAQEIESLRKANQISVAGFAQARESIHAGRLEYEAALEISRAMLEAGSDRLGEGGSQGGHFRDLSDRRFESGDAVDVDISGHWQGYSADTARMVFVGQPTPEVEQMYQVVLEAFEVTLAVIRPGVPAEQVHRVCADYLAQHGYRQVWKVGHGVGLGPGHEAPLVEEGNSTPLERGMVFTVDPGCFLEGGHKDLPIHIEDDVLVTETGAETLTTYTKELIVV